MRLTRRRRGFLTIAIVVVVIVLLNIDAIMFSIWDIPRENTMSILSWLVHNPPSSQGEMMCDVKYPSPTMAMLKRTLAVRGVRRVAIVGIFKDCVYQLQSIERAVLQVADVLSPENVFVSFVESGSGAEDGTPQYLRGMRNRLQQRGVSNVISTGSSRVSSSWKKGAHGSRIDFLGRLRNAAMLPAFASHPEGHFDKFFFVNDVYICGGDILRLLAHDADVACGLDFDVTEDTLYDVWVLSGWWKADYKTWSLPSYKANSPTTNVFSCWNGGIASRASFWYNGVRFRPGMPELGEDDCSQSESSLWVMDIHTLGYHNIILDPTIQVSYGWLPYLSNFRDSFYEVKSSVVSPHVDSLVLDLSNISYRCCELEGTQQHVAWPACNTRKLVTHDKATCDQDPQVCLRYPPTRWLENWNWKRHLKWGVKSMQNM